MRNRMRLIETLFVVLAISLACACSSGGGSGGGGGGGGDLEQGVQGTFATLNGNVGTFEFMLVNPLPTVSAGIDGSELEVAGTITAAGLAPVQLNGIVNDDTAFFSASGGGYSLSGFFDEGLLGGGMFGPTGSGSFAALPARAQLYCGDWTPTGELTPAGLVVVTISGSNAVAVVADFDDAETFLLANSSANSSSVNLSAFNGEDIDLDASGTISGGAITGSWTSNDRGMSANGTWQANLTGCTSVAAH